jgi:RNA polymerase sigma factor (sigma-70 family)
MTRLNSQRLVGVVRSAVSAGSRNEIADAALLRLYVEQRDETAFAILLQRYTRMVIGTARRVLGNTMETDDVCQATFLLLARRASELRRNSVPGWLSITARMIALNARKSKVRRAQAEERAHSVAPTQSPATPLEEVTGAELISALDEELCRLPDRYRGPVVLCCLEGLSRDEAARRLGVPIGTLRSQLERGREKLRVALEKRGLEFGAALLAMTVVGTAGSAKTGVLKGVLAAAEGNLPPTVEALLHGSCKMTMTITKTGLVWFAGVSLVVLSGVLGLLDQCRLVPPDLLFASSRNEVDPPSAPARTGQKGPAKVVTLTSGKEKDGERSFGGTVVFAANGKPVKDVAVLVQRWVEGKPAGEIKLTSDAEGRFKFELPDEWAKTPDAKLTVTVEALGYVGSFIRYKSSADLIESMEIAELLREKSLQLPPFFGQIVLYPTKAIKGRVLGPDGKAVADVSVIISSVHSDDVTHRQNHVKRTKTDADGRFTVEVASPGIAFLYIQPERYAPKVIRLESPSADLGDYKLEAGSELSGKLRDAKGRPLPNRWVRVGMTAHQYDPDFVNGNDQEKWRTGLGSLARWCRTEKDGTFRTGPFAPGEYEASAHDPGVDTLTGGEQIGELLGACVLPQKVKLQSDKVPSIELQAVPHVTIELRVTDQEGKPRKTGVLFSCQYWLEGKRYQSLARNFGSISAPDGRQVLWIPHGSSELLVQRYNGKPTEVCRIHPETMALVEDRFKNQADDLGLILLTNVEKDYTLKFVSHRSVDASIRVTTKDGSPLPNLEIDVRHPRGLDSKDIAGAQPVGGGLYLLRYVEPDRPLDVKIRAVGFEPVNKTVTFKSGVLQRLDIVLEKSKDKE